MTQKKEDLISKLFEIERQLLDIEEAAGRTARAINGPVKYDWSNAERHLNNARDYCRMAVSALQNNGK